MANFPTSLPQAKTDYDGTDKVASADQNNQGLEINAIGAKVGIDSSADTDSHDYKLSGVTGSDKASSVAGAETLTNKTLTSPTLTTPTITNPTVTTGTFTSPTGIVKGDVGLGNVDNTSDATKNAAEVTLTNKTLTTPIISSISNTGTITLPTSTDTLVGRATSDTLTNKTLTSPVLNTSVSGTAILDEDTMSSDSNTKLATQQSIKAYVDTKGLSSKVVATTRDMEDATADVAYTGVGFTPTSINCVSMLDSAESFGWADSTKAGKCLPRLADGSQYTAQSYLTYIHDDTGKAQSAVVKSYDEDGFTITWTKAGTPTGTAQVIFICYK